MAKRRTRTPPTEAPAPNVTEPRPPRLGPAFQGEDALTENQAIDQLLAGLPDDTDNSEASDEIADEAETLEPEAEAEAEDNSGTAAASDEDLIIDETDEETSEPEGPPVYEIPWDDGTVRQMTAEEIRAGTLMRSDYDRKQAERARAEEAAAQSKQAFEAKATALDGLLAEVQRLKETGLPTPPDPALAREDPAEYIAKKADYDAKMVVVEKAQQEAKAAQSEQLRAAQEQNARQLLQAMPAWQDVTKQQADLAEMRQYGATQGWWSGEQFDQGVGNTPHWILQAVHKARLYDRAVARRNGKSNGAAPVQKRVVKSTKTVRTQASQPQSTKGRVARQQAWDSFRKNPGGAGAEERAINALLATIDEKGPRRRA